MDVTETWMLQAIRILQQSRKSLVTILAPNIFIRIPSYFGDSKFQLTKLFWNVRALRVRGQFRKQLGHEAADPPGLQVAPLLGNLDHGLHLLVAADLGSLRHHAASPAQSHREPAATTTNTTVG